MPSAMSSAFAVRVRAATAAHYHYNMGLALLVAGEAEAARGALARAGEDHGAARAAWYSLDSQAGAETGTKIPRIAAEDAAQLWRDLGLLLERRNRMAAAAGCFETAVALCPADDENVTCLGDSRRRQGQLDAARTAYAQALHLSGGHGRAAVRLRDLAEDDIRLAHSLEQQGQNMAALAAWRAAVTTAPENARGWVGLAQALTITTAPAAEIAAAWRAAATAWQQQGVLDEAEAALSRALIVAPQAEFYSALAALDQRRKLGARARHLRRLALTLAPAEAELWFQLGEDCAAAGLAHPADAALVDEAETAFRYAHRLAPQRVGACNGLAQLFAARGDRAAAEAQYRAALAIRPLGVWSLVGLGTVLLSQRPAEAETLARQALACVPDLAEAFCLLGHSLRRQGDTAAADAALRQASTCPLTRTTTLAELAAALLEAGLYDTATALLDPLAGRWFDDQQTEAAGRAWELTVLLRPDCAAAHAGLGLVHERRGAWEAARAAWAWALCLAPARGDLYQACARVLTAQGHPEEAAVARRAALEADVW